LLRGDELEIIGGRGFPGGKDAIGMRFTLDENDAAYPIIKKDLPYIFYPNVQEVSDKFSESEHDHVLSWMAIPLYARGRLIGMITLDGFSVDKFTKEHAVFSLSFANSIAIALENAHLFSEAERRLERLVCLHQIDQTITDSLDLRVTLNTLLRQTLHQLEVDAAAVLIYQPELKILEFGAGQGFRTQALKTTTLQLGQGFAGRAALEKRILRVSNLNQLQTGFLRSPDFPKEGFVAYLGVPLIAKGMVIGVLEIYHRQPLDPDSEWMAFLETLAGQAAIAIDNIKLFNNLQLSNHELIRAYDATIEGWARALEIRDMETEGHSRRVVDLTVKLARELGVEEKQLIHVQRGALLHDIGKMGVPDAILQKPGKLNQAEWDVVKKHPIFAHKWLAPIEYLKPALDIPYCHHERWDGSGYPRGLSKDEIPLSARIFSVVDVWDAMTSDRPYRKRLPKNEVAEYLKSQAGILFDEQVVNAFLGL
jgi:GAF domain-containing protein